MTTSLAAAACCCGPCGGFEVGTTFHNVLNCGTPFIAPPVIGYSASAANGSPIKYPASGTAAWTLPCFSTYSWTSTLYQIASSPGQTGWAELPAVVMSQGGSLFCYNAAPLQTWFVPGPAPGVPAQGRWFGLWRGDCTYGGLFGIAPAGTMTKNGYQIYSWLGGVGAWPIPTGTAMTAIGGAGSHAFNVCVAGAPAFSQSAQQTTAQCGTGFKASMTLFL
jgi:hypothetical protein